jgi:hypothetical protein
MRLLSNHQELLDTLFSEEIIEHEPKGREQMLYDLRQRLGLPEELRPGTPRGYPERPAQTIASFIRRERLRIIARDVWGEARGVDTAKDPDQPDRSGAGMRAADGSGERHREKPAMGRGAPLGSDYRHGQAGRMGAGVCLRRGYPVCV